MKLVSIIVPFFNGEKFVDRFMKTIFQQTYKNIELIIIDDESTDKTKEKVLSYKGILKENNIELRYYFQKNKGLGGSINTGIKYFTGEYLMWLDFDDIITNDSVEKKVCFLEKNKEYGMVRCSAIAVDEFKLDEKLFDLGNDAKASEDIFEGLIKQSIGLSNGRYMLRSSAFLDSNPKREIYESRGGQNWQMLLPVAYRYKCGYIEEVLFKYVIRKSSHSRMDENISLRVSLDKIEEHKKILNETIERISKHEGNTFEKEKYLKIVFEKYERVKVMLAYQFKDKEFLDNQFKKNKELGITTKRDYIILIRGKNIWVDFIFKILGKIKKSFSGSLIYNDRDKR